MAPPADGGVDHAGGEGEAGASDAEAREAIRQAREEMGEEMSEEARVDWLRARGVQIEFPQGHPSAKKFGEAGQSRFTYVLLPADESAPAEERVAAVGSGDVLPRLLGPTFAGKVDDATLLQTAKSHGEEVSITALRAAAAKGGAESFRLAAPTAENGQEAVNAYLDDCSSLKRLPVNARATALARTCGFPADCELRGDIFLGRVRWSENGVVNVDFHLKDLDASSIWQRRAPLENLRFQQETRPDAHEEAQEAARGLGEPAQGGGDGYSWQDSQEDVEVTVHAPGVAKGGVEVAFHRQALEVKRPVQLRLDLFAAVDPDACSWSCCKEGVRITLAKRAEVPWPQLLKP